MQEAITRSAHILYDGKVMETRLHDDVVIDIKDAYENYSIAVEFAQEKKYLSLVITAPHVSITKEAREETNHPNRYTQCIAQAIVVNSLATRLLGNFMVRVLSSHCPQKIFQSRENALEWLEKQYTLHVEEQVK